MSSQLSEKLRSRVTVQPEDVVFLYLTSSIRQKHKMHSKEKQTDEEMNPNSHTVKDSRAFCALGVGRLASVQSWWTSEILAFGLL